MDGFPHLTCARSIRPGPRARAVVCVEYRVRSMRRLPLRCIGESPWNTHSEIAVRKSGTGARARPRPKSRADGGFGGRPEPRRARRGGALANAARPDRDVARLNKAGDPVTLGGLWNIATLSWSANRPTSIDNGDEVFPALAGHD